MCLEKFSIRNAQFFNAQLQFSIFNFLYLQFLPRCSPIFFSFEDKLIAALDHDLGRGVNLTTLHQVATDGFAGTVAEADMQVRTVDGNRTGKTHDLEMAAVAAAVGLVGEADGIMSKTAHTGTDPAGSDLFVLHQLLNAGFEVLPRF